MAAAAFLAGVMNPTVEVGVKMLPILNMLSGLGLRFHLSENVLPVTAVLVAFRGSDLYLSIQTSTAVTHNNGAYAETCLIQGDNSTGQAVFVAKLGYEKARPIRSLHELCLHVSELNVKVRGRSFASFQ